MFLCCLTYVNAVRRRFGEVTKNATDLSQHEALNGAYVHEMTLCVTFFAPHFPTHFRFFITCSKYTVIHMVWDTCVHETILCVTFGARPRSIPFSLLDALFGHLARQSRPRQAKDSGTVPPSDPTLPRDALQTLLRHARGYIETSRRVSFVDGSAKHMKRPDNIGREAGIGRTRDRKEPTIFRACP